MRESLVFALVLTVLAALPVLAARQPAMTDYAAHLARYHVMLAPQRPFLDLYYGFEWKWIGNLGLDILIRPLAAVMPLEVAGRVAVALLALLLALSLVACEWALRRRIGVGSLLALCFVWQPGMLYGFLNYMLSLALALLAFAVWVELRAWRWRWIPFLAVGVVVWLAHVSGWGVLGLMVFGYEWNRSKTWRAFLAPWPLTLPILALVFGGGSKGVFSYGSNVLLFKQTLWVRAMKDSVQWLDISSAILIALVLVAAVAWRRIDGRLGWGALLMMLGSLAMPRHIVGGDYADYRLIGSGLLAACLAVTWRAPRWAFYLAALPFLVRLGVTTETWARQSREIEQETAGLALVPQGARIASVVAIERGQWGFNPYEHICGYAVIRNDALSNCNFALRRVHMISLKGPPPHWNDPSQRLFVWRDHVLDLSDYGPVRDMDWLWYVGRNPVMVPPGSEVVYRTRHSLLLRLAKAPRRS